MNYEVSVAFFSLTTKFVIYYYKIEYDIILYFIPKKKKEKRKIMNIKKREITIYLIFELFYDETQTRVPSPALLKKKK